MENKTKQTTVFLSQVINPKFDRWTGQKYKGNHHDFWVTYKREEDTGTVSTLMSTGRGPGGFDNFEKIEHDVESYKANVIKNGFKFVDDVPYGRSVAIFK